MKSVQRTLRLVTLSVGVGRFFRRRGFRPQPRIEYGAGSGRPGHRRPGGVADSVRANSNRKRAAQANCRRRLRQPQQRQPAATP